MAPQRTRIDSKVGPTATQPGGPAHLPRRTVTKRKLLRRRSRNAHYWQGPEYAKLLGIALIALASLLSNVEMIVNVVPSSILDTIRGEDEVSVYLERFREIRKELLDKSVVGYASNLTREDAGQYGKSFFLTRYALLPVLVVDDLNHDFVIGNFLQEAEARNLGLVKDFGGGVLLLRNSKE